MIDDKPALAEYGAFVTGEYGVLIMPSKNKFQKSITIWPYRSLSRKGFAVVMGVLGLLAFTIGTGFFLAGAWPVIGFLGLELLVVWGAFRLNYRAAKRRQTLTADSQNFEVTNTFPNGKATSQTVSTAWAKVTTTCEDTRAPNAQARQNISIASHGVHVPIGEFLHPAETEDLAREVRDMLHQAQTANIQQADPDWATQLDETSLRPH